MAQKIKKVNGVYMGSQEIASTALATDATLKAYYKFSTGALTTDSSAGGHTLTAISDPAEDASGKFGGACAFDGNDAYYVDNDADLAPSSTFSVGGWVKSSLASTRQSIVTKANQPPSSYSWGLEIMDDSKAQFNLWQTAGAGYLTVSGLGSVITDGVWHFIVGTYNATGTIASLYLDGNLLGTDNTTTGTWNTTANRFEIGGRADGYNFLTGSLDDIFFFNGKALTSDEIYSLYKTGVKKLNGQVNLNPELESTSLRGDGNLVMYQRFEGNSVDETANNNDGTDTAITYGTSYGKVGQGALFNGSSSRIAIADNASLRLTSAFTISAWIYMSDSGNSRCVLSKDSTTSASGYRFGIHTTNKIRFTIPSVVDIDDTGNTIPVGTWVHIALTHSGTNYTFYLNGIQNSNISNANNSTGGTDTGFIGCSTPPTPQYYFYGNIDDLSVFSRALTATEISNLYNTNIKKYNGISNV